MLAELHPAQSGRCALLGAGARGWGLRLSSRKSETGGHFGVSSFCPGQSKSVPVRALSPSRTSQTVDEGHLVWRFTSTDGTSVNSTPAGTYLPKVAPTTASEHTPYPRQGLLGALRDNRSHDIRRLNGYNEQTNLTAGIVNSRCSPPIHQHIMGS
ncbi:hypothetical protein L211DRAFT_864143 [Terfezia boudieri ATCC MYA-4762]|uniref:Uncharacterized protein n=1 Tax=Terfezia boudieri ATCC MYA-4762 TaxID=1051890 RepID=A0A3N4M2W9_9PEZI|nr:hypothetical protein L211DRAFT_864143 [Terfezia boudieri ATCC MYA-4762]